MDFSLGASDTVELEKVPQPLHGYVREQALAVRDRATGLPVWLPTDQGV